MLLKKTQKRRFAEEEERDNKRTVTDSYLVYLLGLWVYTMDHLLADCDLNNTISVKFTLIYVTPSQISMVPNQY